MKIYEQIVRTASSVASIGRLNNHKKEFTFNLTPSTKDPIEEPMEHADTKSEKE